MSLQSGCVNRRSRKNSRGWVNPLECGDCFVTDPEPVAQAKFLAPLRGISLDPGSYAGAGKQQDYALRSTMTSH